MYKYTGGQIVVALLINPIIGDHGCQWSGQPPSHISTPIK